MTPAAAKCTACCDDPHCRSTVVAGTDSGQPAARTALRATLTPCSPIWPTQPQTTSSTLAASRPTLSTRALSTTAERSTGWTPDARPALAERGTNRLDNHRVAHVFSSIVLVTVSKPAAASQRRPAPLARVLRRVHRGEGCSWSFQATSADQSMVLDATSFVAASASGPLATICSASSSTGQGLSLAHDPVRPGQGHSRAARARRVTDQQQLKGHGVGDAPRQLERGAAARDRAPLDLGNPKASGLGGHDQVAGEQRLEAAGQRPPLDRRDQRLARRRSVIPPRPRPGRSGRSPRRNALRSMPAENVPPARSARDGEIVVGVKPVHGRASARRPAV